MADIQTAFRFTLALIGVILSVYSLYVEFQAAHDRSYKALCDINEHVSCSKVFLSKYGRGFGLVEKIFGPDSVLNLPNPIFGIVFYGSVMVLCLFRFSLKVSGLLTLMSAASCIMSIYLAYILYFMKDICVVCVSTYVVNFLLLFLNFQRYNEISNVQKLKEE